MDGWDVVFSKVFTFKTFKKVFHPPPAEIIFYLQLPQEAEVVKLNQEGYPRTSRKHWLN